MLSEDTLQVKILRLIVMVAKIMVFSCRCHLAVIQNGHLMTEIVGHPAFILSSLVRVVFTVLIAHRYIFVDDVI